MQFQLYRFKVIRGSQLNLLNPDSRTADILREAIHGRPSAVLRLGHTWHIGNVTDLDATGIYFACGRTTTSTLERFDLAAGNFVEEEFDSAPYAHVLLDLVDQVGAVSAKARLAPTIPGIARQLERLLNDSSTASSHGVVFEVAEITDPQDLIAHLRSAYAIQKFTFAFSRPNPVDVNADFVRPLQRFLDTSRGDTGRATVSGKNLDASVLEDVARSAAASGDDAEAKVRPDETSRPVKKQLRGNPVTMTEEDPETQEMKIDLLLKIRALFARIRRPITGNEHPD